MIFRTKLAVLVCTASILTPSLNLHAQDKKTSRCQNAYEQLDYEAVPKVCAKIPSDEKKSLEERSNAAFYLAVANTALGKKKAGKAWFVKLLALEPGRELGPEISPDIRKVFKSAQSEFKKKAQVTVAHIPPQTSSSEEFPMLRFVVDDPMNIVAKMELDVQAKGEGYESEMKTVEFAKSTDDSTTFFESALMDPAQGQGGVPLQYVLEYQARFLDAQGKPVPLSSEIPKSQIARQGVAEEESDGSLVWIVAGGATLLVVGVGAAFGVKALCYQGVVCADEGETRAVAGVEAGIAQ